MPATTYYSSTVDGRGHWWKNILDNAHDALTGINYPPAQITAILNDAAWGVYTYLTIRGYYEDLSRATNAYANTLLDAPDGTPAPVAPGVPALPAPPAVAVACGIEARRIKWVQEVKHATLYTLPVGVLLGIETPADPFNYDTHVMELYGLSAVNAHTLSGKFRKAGGHVEAMNLYGRVSGTSAWRLLGTFTATPFSASVPVSGATPELWEFQGRAVRKDKEFGLPSAILEQMIRV